MQGKAAYNEIYPLLLKMTRNYWIGPMWDNIRTILNVITKKQNNCMTCQH